MYVRLRVGRETYALPIENVLEVSEISELAPVPGAASRVLGVRNFHGRVLPVFDLAQVLGVAREGRPARLVVADDGSTVAGLAVDEVTSVAPISGTLEEAEREPLAHATLEDGVLVGIVDVGALFAALDREA